MNKRIRSLIPALALGMAAGSIPTLAAAETTINVVDQAILLAKGAGALVPIEITCVPFYTGSYYLLGNVLLIQRVGNGIAQGSGTINGPDYATITCDETPQTFEIVVPASGKPFHKGAALVQASVAVCNSDSPLCESAQVTEVIQLDRK